MKHCHNLLFYQYGKTLIISIDSNKLESEYFRVTGHIGVALLLGITASREQIRFFCCSCCFHYKLDIYYLTVFSRHSHIT